MTLARTALLFSATAVAKSLASTFRICGAAQFAGPSQRKWRQAASFAPPVQAF